jgi:hypothetical protein
MTNERKIKMRKEIHAVLTTRHNRIADILLIQRDKREDIKEPILISDELKVKLRESCAARIDEMVACIIKSNKNA